MVASEIFPQSNTAFYQRTFYVKKNSLFNTLHIIHTTPYPYLLNEKVTFSINQRHRGKKKNDGNNSPGYNNDTIDSKKGFIEVTNIKESNTRTGKRITHTYKCADVTKGKTSPTLSQTIIIPHNPSKKTPKSRPIKPEPSEIDAINKRLNKIKEEKKLELYWIRKDHRRRMNPKKPDPKKLRNVRPRGRSEKRYIDSNIIKEIVRKRAQSAKKYKHLENQKQKKSLREMHTRASDLRKQANLKIQIKRTKSNHKKK